MLDRLIAETQLREKEPRLEKYLCAVLMTELLFGAGHLSGESKPVQCIRRYEHEFRTLLAGGKSSTTDGTEEAGTIGEKKAEKSSFYQANEKPMFQKGTNACFLFISFLLWVWPRADVCLKISRTTIDTQTQKYEKHK